MFIEALFTIAKLGNQPRCPPTNKENVIYIHNGVSFRHKKEKSCCLQGDERNWKS
jgi:hypothetical protein